VGIRRSLLFSGYRLLRATGYLRLKTRLRPRASVLMYHRVNDYDGSELTTPTAVFAEMLQRLARECHVIPLSDLVRTLECGGAIEPRTVVITFDDGYRDNLKVAAPLLARHGLPATFFIATGHVDSGRPFPWDGSSGADNPVMTWDEVRELAGMGFAIGAHTVNHVNLGKATLAEARAEIVGSKARLEAVLGREVTLFAYPFGGKAFIRDEVRAIVREAGLHCCCNGYAGKVRAGSDPFSLDRNPMYPSTTELFMDIDEFSIYRDGRQIVTPF